MGNHLPCLALKSCKKLAVHKPLESSRAKNSNTISTVGSVHPVLSNCFTQDQVAEKGLIRVKLVLTKKEAAQLLSKFVDGKERRMDLTASDTKRIDAHRSGRGSWRPLLESIPESC